MQMSDWTGKTSPGSQKFPRSARGTEGFPRPLPHPGPYVVQTDSFDDRRGMTSHMEASQTRRGLPTDRPFPSANTAGSEQLHRFAGLGVGLASLAAEHLLSHPWIVLRRQCQVNHDSLWYHVTPFTLFQTIFNIQRHQSATTLWKGVGSTLMVKGVAVATETAISEISPLPKEVNRHTSINKLVGHLFLKSMSYIVISPFYAASLVETVQSEIASERPGVFDCFREGGFRLLSLSTPQTTRLLPIWKLFLPTMTHGMLHYVVASLAQYAVLVSVRAQLNERKASRRSSSENRLYDAYYPELIASLTGSLVADALLFPLETVLHRLCLQGTRTIIDNTDNGLGVIPIITRYEGAVDCFQSVLREEGVSGLYKGFGALVLQYCVHIALLRMIRLVFRLVSSHASGGGGDDVTPGHMMPVTLEEWSRATGHAPQQQQQQMAQQHMAQQQIAQQQIAQQRQMLQQQQQMVQQQLAQSPARQIDPWRPPLQ